MGFTKCQERPRLSKSQNNIQALKLDPIYVYISSSLRRTQTNLHFSYREVTQMSDWFSEISGSVLNGPGGRHSSLAIQTFSIQLDHHTRALKGLQFRGPHGALKEMHVNIGKHLNPTFSENTEMPLENTYGVCKVKNQDNVFKDKLCFQALTQTWVDVYIYIGLKKQRKRAKG